MRSGRRFLRAAGVSAWVLSGTPVILMLQGVTIGDTYVRLTPGQFGFWLAAALIFIVAFWWTSGDVGTVVHRRRSRMLLLVQTAAALSMFHFVCTGLETTLLALVAAQLGLFFPLLTGLAWVVLQTLALIGLAWLHWENLISLTWISLTTPFAVLCLFVSYFAASQAEARRNLQQANSELRATRQLLAETSRLVERTRISRELHDLLGHHLVALSLNMEVAVHKSNSAVKEPLERCQRLSKRLLSDLRDVVREIQSADPIDLGSILSPLVEDIPNPKIHSDLPQDLEIEDAEIVHTIVRCVQEIVTNTVKHARARNLWIQVRRTSDGIEIEGKDDGLGSDGAVTQGRGLRGMTERLRELGGQIEFGTAPGQGFFLNATIPTSETGS